MLPLFILLDRKDYVCYILDKLKRKKLQDNCIELGEYPGA